MTRPVEVNERVGQWFAAFDAIRRELSTDDMRTVLAEMNMVQGVPQLESFMSLARNVMANDRTAAIVAGMLVATGIKPVPVEYDETR